MDFGESKARSLIVKGIAVEANNNDKLIQINTGNNLIRLKLLKKWGEYDAGSVLDFGESKGAPLIAKGIAERVSRTEKKKEVKVEKKKKPKAETAMMEPIAETAEVTPEIKNRRGRPKNKKE